VAGTKLARKSREVARRCHNGQVMRAARESEARFEGEGGSQ
jgi:hypothetical protein